VPETAVALRKPATYLRLALAKLIRRQGVELGVVRRAAAEQKDIFHLFTSNTQDKRAGRVFDIRPLNLGARSEQARNGCCNCYDQRRTLGPTAGALEPRSHD
jgi:hypothetical protein